MSYNKILARKNLGSLMVAGKKVILSAATETSNWKRPESAANALKDPLEKAVSDNTYVLPKGTAEVCTREPDHSSDSDARSHITAVCYDEKGQVIKSVHLPTDKK